MTRAAQPVALLGALLLLTACQGPGSDAASAPAPNPPPGAPTLGELENATYEGFDGGAGAVTLVNGEWEGEPWEEGSASRPRVSLLRDLHVVGDLDGDGVEEAVVLLAESSGGTGTFVHLAVVARAGDGLATPVTTLLGDRVQLRGMRIEDGRLLVDVLRAGPDDAACCPGELATVGFTLAVSGLQPFEPGTPPGRLSLDTLGGAEWVLHFWAWDEEAPGEPEVTLQYEEGRFAGSSGCNRYFASVTETGEAPGEIEVGPVAGTRMACPDPAGAVEMRFLRQLEGARTMGFQEGRLRLVYEKDGAVDAMLFDRREPEA